MRFADTRKKMSSSDWGTLVENQKKKISELENTIKQLEFKILFYRKNTSYWFINALSAPRKHRIQHSPRSLTKRRRKPEPGKKTRPKKKP